MGDLQSRDCFSKMSKSHASVTTLLSSHSQRQGPKRPDLKGMSFVFFLWPTGERQDQVKGFSKDVDEKHGCGCVWKWQNGYTFKMTIYIFNVVGKMMINHETLGFSIFKAMQCHCKCLKPPVSVTLFSSLGAIQTSQTWKEQFENLAIYHGHGKSQICFFRQIIAKLVHFP